MKKTVKSLKKGNKPGWVILTFEDETTGICATDTAPFFGVGDTIDIELETRKSNGKEWSLVQFKSTDERQLNIVRTSALKLAVEWYKDYGLNIDQHFFWEEVKRYEKYISTGETPQKQ